jgi:hypothetical protein
MKNEYITTSFNLDTHSLRCTPAIVHLSPDNLNDGRSCHCRIIRHRLIASSKQDVSLPTDTRRHYDTIPARDRSSRHEDRARDAQECAKERTSGVAAWIDEHIAVRFKNDR